jgi:hypothetical protein
MSPKKHVKKPTVKKSLDVVRSKHAKDFASAVSTHQSTAQPILSKGVIVKSPGMKVAGEPSASATTTRLHFTNHFSTDLVICLEPWGREATLRPEQQIDAVFTGPAGGEPELMVSPGRLTIYGWVGSDAIFAPRAAILDSWQRSRILR